MHVQMVGRCNILVKGRHTQHTNWVLPPVGVSEGGYTGARYTGHGGTGHGGTEHGARSTEQDKKTMGHRA